MLSAPKGRSQRPLSAPFSRQKPIAKDAATGRGNPFRTRPRYRKNPLQMRGFFAFQRCIGNRRLPSICRHPSQRARRLPPANPDAGDSSLRRPLLSADAVGYVEPNP